jgi:hypothetical protein
MQVGLLSGHLKNSCSLLVVRKKYFANLFAAETGAQKVSQNEAQKI